MRSILGALFLLCFGLLRTNAATITWNKASGTYNWNDASNWNTGTVPGSSDDVVINVPTGTNSLVMPSGTVTVHSLSISGSATYARTMVISGCSLVVSGTTVNFSYTNLTTTGSSSVNLTTSNTLVISRCNWGNFPVSLYNNNTTTGSALNINNSTFGGDVTAEAKSLLYTNNTFNGAFTLTKNNYASSTTSLTSNLNGPNTYNGAATITNNDNTSGLYLGADTFNGIATLVNNSTNSYFINVYGGTTSFQSQAYITNTAAGTLNISYGNSNNSVVNFDYTGTVQSDVFINNTGTGRIIVAGNGAVNFNNNNVVIGNASTGVIQIGSSTSLQNATLGSKSSLNFYSVSGTAPSTTPATPYFLGGTLYLNRLIVQEETGAANATLDLNLLNTELFFYSACVFNRAVTVKCCKLSYLGGTFNKAVSFTNLPCALASLTYTYAVLTFNSDVSFINQSANYWYIGSNNASFNSTGSTRSVVTIDNQNTGSLVVGWASVTSIFSFNNVIIKLKRNPSSYTSTPGLIQFGANLETIVDVNSEIQIEQTAGGASGIQFGILAIPGTTYPKLSLYGTMNGSQWTSGIVTIGYFIAKNNFQLYSSPAADNSTTISLFYVPIFEGSAYIKCQNFASYGAWFKGNTTLHLQGSGNASRVFTGTNTFDGTTTLINESLNGNTFLMGNVAADVFTYTGDVLLKNITTSGSPATEIKLARGSSNHYFKGNLRYEGQFGTLPFGYTGSGTCYFNGTTDQTISHTSTAPFLITKMEVNKASGKLIIANNVYVIKYGSVSGLLTLRKGNVVTNPTGSTPTAVGLLTLADDVLITGGGKHSYIEGPVKKEGNDAFTFFTGKGTKYFPISITAQSLTTAAFTAEFFPQNIPVSSAKSGTLKDLLSCQYWTLNQTGTSNPVRVTLPWHNETGQDCAPVDANTVTVARFNSSSWVSEGTLNLVSSPGDSGSVQSNALSAWGYFALGATVANTITPNDVYAVLKTKIDGSYYSAVASKLFFKFEEEYAASGSLNYKVYDEQRNVMSLSALIVQYGDNRYALDASALTAGKYYVLEVCNSKKEKFRLRFKV